MRIDADGSLLCPKCGHDCTHLDDTFVAGRPREDGPFVRVHVDSHGRVAEGASGPTPADGEGRRHHIAIAGWCEECRTRFAVVFKQHKGATKISTVIQRWEPVPDSVI